LVSVATAFASIVFPVPGGPCLKWHVMIWMNPIHWSRLQQDAPWRFYPNPIKGSFVYCIPAHTFLKPILFHMFMLLLCGK
jgi:hypothetical protein